MSKRYTNKYLVPVEITTYQPYSWLPLKTYTYKLYASNSDTKFTHIKLIDINGAVIGEHMPVQLQTLYDRATEQLKTNTVKAVTEIKNAVDGVANIAVDAVNEMKSDASKTANIALGLAGKLQAFAKAKLAKKEAQSAVIDTTITETTPPTN